MRRNSIVIVLALLFVGAILAYADEAVLIEPPPEARASGFCLPGLRDPRPLPTAVEHAPGGLY